MDVPDRHSQSSRSRGLAEVGADEREQRGRGSSSDHARRCDVNGIERTQRMRCRKRFSSIEHLAPDFDQRPEGTIRRDALQNPGGVGGLERAFGHAAPQGALDLDRQDRRRHAGMTTEQLQDRDAPRLVDGPLRIPCRQLRRARDLSAQQPGSVRFGKRCCLTRCPRLREVLA